MAKFLVSGQLTIDFGFCFEAENEEAAIQAANKAFGRPKELSGTNGLKIEIDQNAAPDQVFCLARALKG